MLSRRNSQSRRTILAIVSVALAAALIAPAAAFAQSSSAAGYGGVGSDVQGTLDGGNDGGSGVQGTLVSGTSDSSEVASTTDAGSLPFTGLDLGWMIGGGVLLVGAGIAMGRAASRDPQTR